MRTHDHVTPLTTTEFDAVITARSGVALVDFGAVWCGPCRGLAPVVAAIAAEHAGHVLVATVDVDEEPELGQRFQIRSLPTLIFFRDGRPVDAVVGAVQRRVIDERLRRILDSRAQLRATPR